ncbi:GSCFA domain-containing protein [Galbibacter sp. EGI 63066]|uniref:GSCFA domain-containing protein n=1 Tax=Galbibacter sp. EGI 63066 TaxID=2993559 RepID=UPI002248F260|nr:GSCFA domain-containing protein [Galbibacter sp. EGI 63066]MCX2679415.1 GSCFA domain-containing protein [Galbibacter sp. EGI 63066]
MKLQTNIPLHPADNQIDYGSRVWLMGSCFVENIGNKFQFYKFQTTLNPFGIIFHPLAIQNLLQRLADKRLFTEEDIFFLNGRWHSFEVHSSLSDASKENLLSNLNTIVRETTFSLQKASHVVLTLGTAWGYRYKRTDQWVANCHKVPQKEFDKALLSVGEVTETLKSCVALLQKINPKAELIFTVSPVRHIKDGFVENTLSKAHLISAVHNVLQKNPPSLRGGVRGGAYFPPSGGLKGDYFPSYEIMMDELRDYRFYNQDMLHPNATAIDYIWERFCEVWVSPSAGKTMKEVESVQNGLSHKPFNPDSEEHRRFLEKLQQKIAYLSKQYPHIEF